MATGGGLKGWLDRHDPTRYATHRGIRAALAVTGIIPVSRWLLDDPQFVLFAAFGSLALLIFVDFPGNPRARASSYVLLGLTGLILITVGTLMSRTGAIAVIAMAVVGFLILFAGVLSAALAASSRVLLLAFVLPVTVPVTAAEILPRLGGWSLGMLVAIPLALFAWPPQEHRDLRRGVSRSCRALASAVDDTMTGSVSASAPAVDEALGGLRRSFRASVARPIGLSAGGRMLAGVMRDLDWLWIEVRGASASTNANASAVQQAQIHLHRVAPEVVAQNAVVLRAASDALDDPSPATRDRLNSALDTLSSTRRKAVTRWLDDTLSGRPPADLPVVERVHSMGYATELAGRQVWAALAADARGTLDRILGRRVLPMAPGQVPGTVQAGGRLIRHHLSWQSVWFHNSLRGGLGMALAVLLAQVTEVSHGFWVALGAMSVLRSSALNTGATAFRAVAGTLVGVVVGAGALILLDGSPAAWVVLPIAMFLAGFANDAISFAAGQAAFSIAVLIMFSLLGPAGWQVGLVRLEDVAIGAGAGVVVGLLLWPRGASGAIRRAMADALRWNSRLLANAVERMTAEQPPTAVDPVDVLGAAYRLDDALRQYLADRGAKSADIDDLIAVCVGTDRVRLTTEALHTMAGQRDRPDQRQPAQPSEQTDRGAPSPAPQRWSIGPAVEDAILPSLAQDYQRRAHHQAHWLDTVAQELSDDTTGIAPAPPADAVAAVLSDAHRHPDDANALRSTPADVWIAIHLDDLARHERRMRPRALALGSSPGAYAEPEPATG